MTSTTPAPWWYAPLTVSALQCAAGCDAELVLDDWIRLGFNCEQLLHPIADGYYGLFDPARHHEVIGSYVEKAHAEGVRIILYLNTHMLPRTIESEHPEYFARNPEGQVLQAYNKLFGFVDAASAWRELSLQSARDAVAMGVDGIFSDGPVAVNSWSDGTREACRQRYGLDLEELDAPRKNELDHWIVDQLVHDMYQAVQEISTDCLFYTNLELNRTPVETLRSMSMLGSEGGFGYYGPPRHSIPWRVGYTARILEGWHREKPRMIFISADYKPWHRTLKPGADIARQAAAALQHGCHYWIGLHSPAADLKSPELHAVAELNRLVQRESAVLGPSESLATIALYRSSASLGFDPTEQLTDKGVTAGGAGQVVAGHEPELQGWGQALIYAHLPFDVLSADITTPDLLARYRTLVLPGVCVLSADEVEALENWVAGGGRLLVSADPGRLALGGELLPRAALCDLLGLEAVGGIEDRGHYNYSSWTADRPAWLESVDELLPDWPRALEVKPAAATAIARYHEAVVGQYHPLPPLAGPAIFIRKHGRGEAIFISGNIGETFGLFSLPAHLRFMRAALLGQEAAPCELPTLPGCVEIALRRSRATGETLLHLVNHGGNFDQPLHSPAVLHEVEILLPQPVATARSLQTGRTLPVESTGAGCRVVLPRLEVYDAVVWRQAAPL